MDTSKSSRSRMISAVCRGQCLRQGLLPIANHTRSKFRNLRTISTSTGLRKTCDCEGCDPLRQASNGEKRKLSVESLDTADSESSEPSLVEEKTNSDDDEPCTSSMSASSEGVSSVDTVQEFGTDENSIKMETDYPEEDVDPGDGTFKVCKVCKIPLPYFNQKYKTKFKIHMEVHYQKRPYPCQKCGEFFKTANRLITHDGKVHTNEKHYECEFCDEKYRTNSKLIEHKRKSHYY